MLRCLIMYLNCNMNVGKIFRKNISKWQVVLIGFGSFTGLLMIWLPLQIYFDINKALHSQKDLFGGQYLVINKGVSLLNTMGMPSSFSADEIEALKKQPGVKSAGVFTPNNFKAMAGAGLGPGGPQLLTEVFFEAVPDRFIDELPPNWHWSEGDPEIPVMVPSDYLSLYNFGFAPGQGLPQISQNTAKLVSFSVFITVGNKQVTMKGRIAGFSDRINTILAPQSFIDYGNAHFGNGEQRPPSRVIIETTDAQAVATYLEKMGYETNKEALHSDKVESIARAIMQIALAFGGLIVILSMGSFLQFSDLLIARSDFEIKTLSFLGYNYKRISGFLFTQVFGVIVIAMILAALAGIAVRYFLLQQLTSIITEPTTLPDYRAVVVLIVMVAVYLTGSYISILRQAKLQAAARG